MLKPNLLLKNSVFTVFNSQLLENEPDTYLSDTAVAASGTLTVQNITGLGVSDYLVLGKFGEEQTELVQVHAVTAPTGSTVTLVANTVYSHPIDTPVQRVSFNQVEFSRATASGGDKSVLTTKTISVDDITTVYNDTTNTTGYGYIRFKNSTATTYSQYSDEQSYASLAWNAVGTIIDRVFRIANEKGEDFISRGDVRDFLWDFLDTVSDLRTIWRKEETDQDTSNSTTIAGKEFTLPTGIKFADERGIIDIRTQGGEPLKWLDPKQWATKIAGLSRSTLNGAVLEGATTLTLEDTTDIPDSGNGYIAGDLFSWTGITANTLTGVSGVLDHDSGSVFYEENSLGTPTHYTILNGVGKLYPAPDSESDSKTLIIDHYAHFTYPDSDNDIFPFAYLSPTTEHCLMRVEERRRKFDISEIYRKSRDRQLGQIIKQEKSGRSQQFQSKE